MESPEQRHERADKAGQLRALLGQLRDIAGDLDDSIVLVARDIDLQPNEQMREGFLNLLVGMTHAADGIRALADQDIKRFDEQVENYARFQDMAMKEFGKE